MAGDGDEAGDSIPVLDGDGDALRVQFNGAKFDGGRLPISALATLTKMEAMVRAIARDLDVSSREDATRASKYANVELVLVGEIEEGSARLRALLLPLVLALPGPSQAAQAALVHKLPEVVPIVVQAVHQGGALPDGISGKTVSLVAEVGQALGAGEELVLSPGDESPDDVTGDRSATVTLASSNEARRAREVSDSRSFFVTGTLRQLENHGDSPGKLTLATGSGLHPVPEVQAEIVERAARLLSDDRNGILAISGKGTFDGRGRLKRLEHLSDMQRIDRPFNPEQRFAELSELSEAPLIEARIDLAQAVISRAVLATGRAPGLFLDEDDQIEARWLIHRTPESPATVVNVSFGATIDVYVFDREAGEVTLERELDLEDVAPGDLIAEVIEAMAGDADG
jgi:hypothetical protein